MASASTPSVNEPTRDSVHTVKLKPIIRAQISEKLLTSGISDVAITSAHSKKTRLKKMIMIISMNKSQESMVFGRCQKLTSTMKVRPEK